MAWNTKSFELLSKHVSTYLGGIKETSCFFQGQEWKYLDAGSGDIVLCLHGLGGSKVQWRTFMTKVSERYRVISPDVPGLSLSLNVPEGDIDKHNVANWIIDFMDTIGVKHVHVVGHDTGGVVASYFAHGQKGRVRTLAWFNPPDLDGIRTGDVAAWERVKVGFDSMQQAETHLMSLFYDPPTLPGIVKRFYMKKVMDTVNKGKLLPLINGAMESLPLLMAQVRGIQQETLVVAADNDVFSNERWILKLVAMIPNSKLVRLEECGQRSLIEKPDQLAEIYLDFLKTRGS